MQLLSLCEEELKKKKSKILNRDANNSKRKEKNNNEKAEKTETIKSIVLAACLSVEKLNENEEVNAISARERTYVKGWTNVSVIKRVNSKSKTLRGKWRLLQHNVATCTVLLYVDERRVDREIRAARFPRMHVRHA